MSIQKHKMYVTKILQIVLLSITEPTLSLQIKELVVQWKPT